MPLYKRKPKLNVTVIGDETTTSEAHRIEVVVGGQLLHIEAFDNGDWSFELSSLKGKKAPKRVGYEVLAKDSLNHIASEARGELFGKSNLKVIVTP